MAEPHRFDPIRPQSTNRFTRAVLFMLLLLTIMVVLVLASGALLDYNAREHGRWTFQWKGQVVRCDGPTAQDCEDRIGPLVDEIVSKSDERLRLIDECWEESEGDEALFELCLPATHVRPEDCTGVCG